MADPKHSAFPIPTEKVFFGRDGLTKREYFAALAMQGMLTSSNMNWKPNDAELGEFAVMAADNLLAALNKF